MSAVLTFFFVSSKGRAQLHSEKTNDAGIDGAVFSGISILTNRSSSYSTKSLPVIGISLFPYYTLNSIWDLVCEVSFHHSFRSNYDNYFYYSSHRSISFVPGFQLHFLTNGPVSGILHAGFGFSHAFSNFIGDNYFVACGGLGIKFINSRINSLFVSYHHSFLLDFYHYETIRVYITVRLWSRQGKLRGSDGNGQEKAGQKS
jgi:hypothetical protein